MKSILTTALMLFFGFLLKAQVALPSLNIIPQPASMVQVSGFYVLTDKAILSIPGHDSLPISVSEELVKKLTGTTGYQVIVEKNAPSAAICLQLIASSELGPEGYSLSVTPRQIRISGNTAAGIFYGIQTLYQLLPKEIESNQITSSLAWTVPCVEIKDFPRFAWRGMLFDVCRHFFTKDQVKQFIREMVKYKYNVLHLHLTEDEGWRIEIKTLPKLTAVGAWRINHTGKWGNVRDSASAEPATYGGFYSQDDIRELVQYAKDRFVNILPEIDMPGHSLAAIASYPELLLSCTPSVYQVSTGQDFMQWPGNGGAPIASVANMLCPANEKVYELADKVFTEVAQLFPFEYIHIGGDECAKNYWANSNAVKMLMQKEGLTTMEQVQAYFEKRIEKIVESKGKKVIGWDEILEGGLAPNASVMSWRGMKGGIAAAKLNHTVVMSPTDYTYLDYCQGEPSIEPPVYANLRLNKTYTFDPLPPGVDPKFILGGEATLWTEQLPEFRSLEYMLWPRALAVAECVWSSKEKKNWPDFVRRVENHFDRLDMGHIKYARSMYDPIIAATKDSKGTITVELGKELDNLDIYYSFDETNPDNFYPKYNIPLIVPKDAATLKIISYKAAKVVGHQINLPIEELRKRAVARF